MTARSEFERQVRQYTKRSDYAPEDYDAFVRGALAELRRDFRPWELQETLTADFTDSTWPTPPDFAELAGATIKGALDTGQSLRSVSAARIARVSTSRGSPEWIALDGDTLRIAPGGSDAVELVYWRSPPAPPTGSGAGAIGSAEQVTTDYETVYRYALLAQALEWAQDYAAMESAQARYAAAVDLANGYGQQARMGRAAGFGGR